MLTTFVPDGQALVRGNEILQDSLCPAGYEILVEGKIENEKSISVLCGHFGKKTS